MGLLHRAGHGLLGVLAKLVAILAIGFTLFAGAALYQRHKDDCFYDSHSQGKIAGALATGKVCTADNTWPCPPLLTCHGGRVVLRSMPVKLSPAPSSEATKERQPPAAQEGEDFEEEDEEDEEEEDEEEEEEEDDDDFEEDDEFEFDFDDEEEEMEEE